MGTFQYALLEHRFYLFGLIKRYNFIGCFNSEDAAARFARDCYGADAYSIRRVTLAEKSAMSLSLIGR